MKPQITFGTTVGKAVLETLSYGGDDQAILDNVLQCLSRVLKDSPTEAANRDTTDKIELWLVEWRHGRK